VETAVGYHNARAFPCVVVCHITQIHLFASLSAANVCKPIYVAICHQAQGSKFY
jgi:hypothetical protein